MKMEEAPCLRVPKRLGSKAILATRGLKLLDHQLTVKRENDYVVIPLSRKPTLDEAVALREKLQEVNIATDKFNERRRPVKSIHEALRDRLPPKLLIKLPHSMDVIGQVAIVEVPPELEGYKHLLGEAVLEVNRGIETVLAKAGAVGGECRLRAFEMIAGTGETETVYKEHSCIYTLDPTKVYFSPRLSQERWRIAQKVSGGEVVIDLFAGVGPFSIQIAKKHSDTKVYAIDVNPDATHFLNRNIAANKVDNVFPILGDAREVVKNTLSGKADRVIMNLPKSAINFIDVACKALKPYGGTIHYYEFGAEPNALEKAEESLSKEVSRAGRTVKTILDSRLIRPTAPHEWQIAIDILVS